MMKMPASALAFKLPNTSLAPHLDTTSDFDDWPEMHPISMISGGPWHQAHVSWLKWTSTFYAYSNKVYIDGMEKLKVYWSNYDAEGLDPT